MDGQGVSAAYLDDVGGLDSGYDAGERTAHAGSHVPGSSLPAGSPDDAMRAVTRAVRAIETWNRQKATLLDRKIRPDSVAGYIDMRMSELQCALQAAGFWRNGPQVVSAMLAAPRGGQIDVVASGSEVQRRLEDTLDAMRWRWSTIPLDGHGDDRIAAVFGRWLEEQLATA